MTRKTGTREWSDHSINCRLGCAHGCLYCYARTRALRFHALKPGSPWSLERPGPAPKIRRYRGRVMFPTSHDLTREGAGACLDVLAALLAADNDVLVVSKAGAHVPSLVAAARCLAGGRGEVELRVTITCVDERIRRFWEPGAPDAGERLGALLDAHRLGLAASVACEPCLEPEALPGLVRTLVRHARVRGEIWIGAANRLRARTAWCRGLEGLEEEIRRVEAGQTPEAMRGVYEALKDHPQVRWKDSYQRALGIDALGRNVPGMESRP